LVLFYACRQASPEASAPPEKNEPPAKLTFLNDGGWCWFQDPRAVINNGKLVVGGVEGQKGDLRIGVYDLMSNKFLGEKVLHKELEVDDHDAPVFYPRPDGSLLCMWAKHGKEKIHYYCISADDNYLEWGEIRAFNHNYDHRMGVTYMNLYYLEDEKLLYNFFRDGPTYNPSFITSSDQGTTWGNRTHFIANDVGGYQRPYARYVQIDPNTVGISYTDAHPRNFGNSLYYAEFRNQAFYNADGSKIKDLKSGPLYTSEGEKVYQGSEILEKKEGFESVPNSAWTSTVESDAQNHPHIGYSVYLSNEDHRYRLASWNGEQWHDREIAYAGTCLYQRESSYTGLLTLDPFDPSNVYISTDVNQSTGKELNGKHEIFYAKIGNKDDISSIKWQPLTSDSEHDNLRPMMITGEGYKVLAWLYGPWNTYTDYDVDVVGMVLESP
jgi:hypothetical protein